MARAATLAACRGLAGLAAPQMGRGASTPAIWAAWAQAHHRGLTVSRRTREEEKKAEPWVDDGIRPPPVSPMKAGHAYVVELQSEEPDQEYYKNALLSDKVKEEIFALSKKPEWTTQKLAEKYKVRQQRIMAIVALKELERKAEAEGKKLYREFEARMEKTTGVVSEGTGEVFQSIVITEPSYEVVHDALPSGYTVQPLIVKSEADKEIEKRNVAEFKQRLETNLGKFAPGLHHQSRLRVAPRRPAEGWSLLVKPLGAAKEAPFVALPDGSKRELSQTERDYIQINTVKPRRRTA